MIRLNSDEAFAEYRDVLEGVRFSATLHVSTPLATLLHHGEVFRGPPSQAPVYGTMSQGIWVLQTKSWKSLGAEADIPEYSPTTHASDIGAISPDNYLLFLVAFRTIFEAPITHDEKLRQLGELPLLSTEFAAVWSRLNQGYVDFPRCLFYLPFTQLPGVGRVTARNLYDAGFVTLEDILKCKVGDLISVPGIGFATAEKIVAYAAVDLKSAAARSS